MSREGPVHSVSLVRPGNETERVDLTDQVTKFTYTDRERAADLLSLSVDNFDLSNFDDPVWKKGQLLDVTWGYPGNMAPTRRVVIKSVRGSEDLTIECFGQEILMGSERRSRTFENVKRSDVVRTIAEEQGWTGDRVDIQDTAIRHETIVQARRTDAEFLRRLARLEGFEWYVDWDGFHFHERRVGARPIRIYVWRTSTGIGNVLDFDVENDVTARPGRVRLRGRNPTTGRNFEVTADNGTDTIRNLLAPILALVNPESGAISRNPRRSTTATPEARVAQVATRPTSAPNATIAQKEATARFRRAQQAAVKMTLSLIGDAGMLAKSVVELKNFGRRLSQRYYVREVVHTVDPGSGYEMEAKLISDGHRGHSTRSRRARGLSGISVGRQARGTRNTKFPTAAARAAATGAGGGSTGGRSPREGQPLEPVRRVDPETGRIRTTYRDARGRERTGATETTSPSVFRFTVPSSTS